MKSMRGKDLGMVTCKILTPHGRHYYEVINIFQNGCPEYIKNGSKMALFLDMSWTFIVMQVPGFGPGSKAWKALVLDQTTLHLPPYGNIHRFNFFSTVSLNQEAVGLKMNSTGLFTETWELCQFT